MLNRRRPKLRTKIGCKIPRPFIFPLPCPLPWTTVISIVLEYNLCKSHFCSHFITSRRLLKDEKINLIKGRVRHPQSQGKVERKHRDVRGLIEYADEPPAVM